MQGLIRDHSKSYPNPDDCRPIPWPSYMYAYAYGTYTNLGGSRSPLILKKPYSLDSQLPAHYAACRDCKSRFCICPISQP